MTQYLFIDYENTQRVRLEEDESIYEKIFIFLGRSQNKLDFELVQRLQALGPKVEWVKIGGEGKNNLDFHLSYMLGRMDAQADRGIGFVVLSRDKGYDAVLRYISEQGREARRVDGLGRAQPAKPRHEPAGRAPSPKPAGRLGPSRGRRVGARGAKAAPRQQAPEPARVEPAAGVEARVLAALSRLAEGRRPSTRKSLCNYLENQHGAGKSSPPAEAILERLAAAGKVVVEQNRVTYHL